MTKLEIIELIIISIIVIALITWLVIKAIKNNWISEIMETVNKAIKDAENTEKSGKEKKEYVIGKVKNKCDELSIPYSLLANLINKLIDTIIKHYNVIIK